MSIFYFGIIRRRTVYSKTVTLFFFFMGIHVIIITCENFCLHSIHLLICQSTPPQMKVKDQREQGKQGCKKTVFFKLQLVENTLRYDTIEIIIISYLQWVEISLSAGKNVKYLNFEKKNNTVLLDRKPVWICPCEHSKKLTKFPSTNS